MPEWTLEKIEQLISGQVQEHLQLEYKAADALGRTDSKKSEVTKDISAMANSAGGIIIYGVKEFREKNNEHLPEKIDPVNQVEYSKEWLEQIIKTIRPRIEGIIIIPVSVSPNQVIYVVEVPKSDTAHQARDDRYHKRYNFTTSHMEDYEIRDVMNRNKNPKLALSFTIHQETIEGTKCFSLFAKAENIGAVYAKYVNIFVEIPHFILPHFNSNTIYDDNYLWQIDNTVRDLTTEHPLVYNPTKVPSDFKIINGPSRYAPILPGLSKEWSIKLRNLGNALPRGHFSDDDKLEWKIYADNAFPVFGETHLKDIELVSIYKEPQ